jgi:hypothetical protein
MNNESNTLCETEGITFYRISRPRRRTFPPEECDLNSTGVLCAEGQYYFQNYKYPYPHRVKKNHEDDFSGSDDDCLGFYDE